MKIGQVLSKLTHHLSNKMTRSVEAIIDKYCKARGFAAISSGGWSKDDIDVVLCVFADRLSWPGTRIGRHGIRIKCCFKSYLSDDAKVLKPHQFPISFDILDILDGLDRKKLEAALDDDSHASEGERHELISSLFSETIDPFLDRMKSRVEIQQISQQYSRPTVIFLGPAIEFVGKTWIGHWPP